MADCPECEYCCLIGLCCPPNNQRQALVDAFTREGVHPEAAAQAADVIVAARAKAQRKA